jgi:hypothetical protein
LQLDRRFIILGILVCITPYLFGLYRKQALRQELNSIIMKRAAVATANPDAPYEELMGLNSEYKKKIATLQELINKQLFITVPLNIIPRFLPKGMWLTSLTFNKVAEYKANMFLEGMIFLADSDKEIETANKFLMDLKGDPDFSKHFKEVNITSLDRKPFGNATATAFVISFKAD